MFIWPSTVNSLGNSFADSLFRAQLVRHNRMTSANEYDKVALAVTLPVIGRRRSFLIFPRTVSSVLWRLNNVGRPRKFDRFFRMTDQ